MSSTPSSSSSPLTPPQLNELINEILNANADKAGFDLGQLVAQTDVLVARYEDKLLKKNPMVEKLGELPSNVASDASTVADQVSTNAKQIANQIKEYSGNNHQTSIEVLNAIGNIHWAAVGFLLVGVGLNIADTIQNNREECFRLFKSVIDLSKVILQLKELPSLKMELHSKLNKSIHLIVKGFILCCSQMKRKGFKRVLKASSDKQKLQQLHRDIDEMRMELLLQIGTSTLKGMQILVNPPPPALTLNRDTVGIEEKIEEVIQCLDWENDIATTAVLVYGIGGAGKTTLADAVYASLKDKLQGWKHSKIILIENLEKDPKVEDLQSLILQDLTATKHTVRDFQSGRQSLKDLIEKEPVFLYVDNALYLEPLEKLLPKDVSSAKKFRLLITAREMNASGVIEDCGIEPCKLYDIGSLSIDAALKVLCRKINRKREEESILQERPQAREIVKKCVCSPLYLEVIGAYIHQRKNNIEAYERVLDSLQSGDDFSGNENYKLDDSKLLFSYERLNPSAKEAFLDICSFFSGWSWKNVAWTVGEEEIECLQDGALIKREDGRIRIHDLILAAGRNKSKHVRIKCVEDFSLVLKNEELIPQVKGVWIEDMENPFVISAEELDAMSRSLRVFYLGKKANNLIRMKGKCSGQFSDLRFLHVQRGVSNLPINIFNLNHLRYLSINDLKENIILSPSMNLPKLNVLKFVTWNRSRIDGIAEIAHLRSLKQLDLSGCNTDGISQCFSNLHNLLWLKLDRCDDLTELADSLVKLRSLQELSLEQCTNLKQLPAEFRELASLTKLDLSCCSSLHELPESLVKLRSLQELNLSCCGNLKQLPAGFGELVSLTKLDLSNCRSLQELPCDLEKLPSLRSLKIHSCSSLHCLPSGLGNVWGSNIFFDGCSSLSELPEEICKNTKVTYISLTWCSSLEKLPSRFGELTCLQDLWLYKCERLQELCNDFHCLVGLKTLNLQYCKNLSSLPLGFGRLSSLESLNLSGCDKLEELCSDFHCLVALKKLYLSRCESLCNLPDHFGKLGCLESLDLTGCSNLVKLSDDFHLLRSLTRLDLSKCENLGGEWMDSVGKLGSLWRLDIVRSGRLIQRWMETKSQKERNLVVVTDFPQGGKGWRTLLLEGVLSKVFDEEGLLLDAHQGPFHSSSVQPQTPLIFIIDKQGEVENKMKQWGILGKNLKQLELNSKASSIIYVGPYFSTLNTSELAARMLAYTPQSPQTSSFCRKLYAVFNTGSIAVFRSTGGLEENGIKCFSAWEDISYVLDRVAFLTETHRESNIELLTELMVNGKQDYLLLNENRQVKIADLQGKLTLLLITSLDENQACLSAVKEVYVKMQESHNCVVEVVWIPSINGGDTWEEFVRAVDNAPWPVVPNPWWIKKGIHSFIGNSQRIPCLCVVDEKGKISNKDAMPMIERWGVDAYPFSHAREEELKNAEWEELKFSCLSSFQFVFQNLPTLSNKAKEMMDRGVMMLFCVGLAENMMELASDLNCALTKLEMDFQVFYVACRDSAEDYDMACEKLKENESEKCSIATLSFSDLYKFWRRVKHLQKDLNGMGADERIVKVRRMVLGLASAKEERWRYESGISIVVVDGNGEMVSLRGMEVVELLCHGEEDSKKKLVEDIKNVVVEKSVESRWRDGIIHPKHYPQHPLLLLRYSDRICSLCGYSLGVKANSDNKFK
ncbi:hypothetical protein SUGI_0707800 [Cryptomeria japonica]|nr:hypothetical protein SUGI_0707800 [Cryptomeria japonica]